MKIIIALQNLAIFEKLKYFFEFSSYSLSILFSYDFNNFILSETIP